MDNPLPSPHTNTPNLLANTHSHKQTLPQNAEWSDPYFGAKDNTSTEDKVCISCIIQKN